MLTFPAASPMHFCGGLSRRNFLKLGTLGLGGLTLAELLADGTGESGIDLPLAGHLTLAAVGRVADDRVPATLAHHDATVLPQVLH